MALGCMGPIFRPQSPDAALTEVDSESPRRHAAGQRRRSPVRHGLCEGRKRRAGDRPGRHRRRPRPLAPARRAACGTESPRNQESQRSARLAQHGAGAGARLPAARHPGGRHFDVEVRTPTPQRHHQPPRRLAAWKPASPKWPCWAGRFAPATTWRSPKGRFSSTPPPRPTAIRRCATRGPRAHRRRRHQVAAAGTDPRSPASVDSPEPARRQSRQRAIPHLHRRPTHGRRHAEAAEYIELALHPRYKDNVGRYMRVVRSVAIDETPVQRMERLKLLGDQLLDPVTAETAAAAAGSDRRRRGD